MPLTANPTDKKSTLNSKTTSFEINNNTNDCNMGENRFSEYIRSELNSKASIVVSKISCGFNISRLSNNVNTKV